MDRVRNSNNRSVLLRLCLVIALFASKSALAEWDEWLADADLSFSAEDNITRAVFGREEKSEQYWSGFFSLGRLYHFSGFTRMEISAQVDGRVHHKYSRLNQVNTGLRLGVRHKLGLGPNQPWIKGFVSSGHIFSRSKIRQGFLTQTGIRLGKQIHNRIGVEVGYLFDHRKSRDGNAISRQRLIETGLNPEISNSVYDLSGHSANLQLNIGITEQLLLNSGYTFRTGDIVSINSSLLASRLDRVADAVVNDDAFPGWAYRADGITHSYSVNASYAMMQGHAMINLNYQHSVARAKSFTYRNNLFRVNFIYYF